MGEYKMDVNTEKNRMSIRISGFMTDQELKVVVDEALVELRKMKPGFAIINDISEFKPASPSGAKELLRVQKFVNDLKPGRIIRVVGSDKLGRKQFEKNSQQAGYAAETAPSIEAAEKMLDG
ncbi:MAG: hypothetical protein SVJ22_00820 [Halobacteriota archaeon]|nr:hypothetical protein [Halobacteriota archaeon]